MKIPGVFLCLSIALFWPIKGLADCGLPSGASVQVVRVSDGDTLKLQDGRSVRVLGINAPEITHGKKAGQPLGRESRAAAQMFINRTQGRVRLGFEQELHDHYGRLLAHVYDSHGRSLAAEQLRLGMAMQVAVPPNIAQAKCLVAVEQSARKKKLGVWRNHYWQPLPSGSMRGDETGFRLVSGRVAKVDINSAVWLELEGKLVARVAKKDWPLFDNEKFGNKKFGYYKRDWQALVGRKIELRGWISQQKSKRSQQFKPLVLQLRSPSSIKVIAN
jgi:endonuclease YncB( thermonuclease family)